MPGPLSVLGWLRPATEDSWRWLAVAAGVGLLIATVSGAGTALDLAHRLATTAAAPADLRQLAGRIQASAQIPHQGVAESRGALGLPDLPRLGGVSALLGGTTRSRVWWLSNKSWRVDTLSLTGEQGTYGDGQDVVGWDYERRLLTTVVGSAPVRLPRTDDLLPPQAARWLLGGIPGDRLTALPDRRVAGRHGVGLRVQPADLRGTIGRVDVWVDRSGLPLELRVANRSGIEIMVTRFLDLKLEAPDEGLVVPPDPPGARSEKIAAQDLAAPQDGVPLWDLPTTLAGLPVSNRPDQGGASYGRGLLRIVVIPLSGHLAGHLIEDAEGAGAQPVTVPGGQAVVMSSSLVSAIVARGPDRGHAYLLAGLVTPDLLQGAAASLVRDPPPGRAR
jgi:hypothetical protein